VSAVQFRPWAPFLSLLSAVLFSGVKLHEALPDFQFEERHSTLVNATPEQVYDALLTLDFRRSATIRALFFLRSGGGLSMSLQKLGNTGFLLLDQQRPRSILLGIAGRFWRPSGSLVRFRTPEEFINYSGAGHCKAIWSFLFKQEKGGTMVTTVTRIHCVDASARRRFRIYWLLVRPFSGLVRREILRLLRTAAYT
jgi:hypothetical protein